MQVADISRTLKEPATIIIDNRFDILNDGVTMNAYERIRRK